MKPPTIDVSFVLEDEAFRKSMREEALLRLVCAVESSAAYIGQWQPVDVVQRAQKLAAEYYIAIEESENS